MFMTRPSRASQAYVHEFAPNTNEKFFDTTASINERKILISHSWSARLLRESKAAGLSTNLFTDELESSYHFLRVPNAYREFYKYSFKVRYVYLWVRNTTLSIILGSNSFQRL